jgi:hypothetical protein
MFQFWFDNRSTHTPDSDMDMENDIDLEAYFLGDNLGKTAYTDWNPKELSAWDILDRTYYQTFVYEDPVTEDCHVCLIDKSRLKKKMKSGLGHEGTVLVIIHPERQNLFETSIKNLRYPLEHKLFAPAGYSWKHEEGKKRISIKEIADAYYELVDA